MSIQWQDHFTEEPCRDALEYLETQEDIQAAWQNCKRGDWMWWALRHSTNPQNAPTKELSVSFARSCAKRAGSAADAAAAYAADAADAAYDADAAAAAAAAAYAAYADADAAAAAYAAAYAAYAAAAAAAAYATEYETLKQCANIVRKYYPNPPIQ